MASMFIVRRDYGFVTTTDIVVSWHLCTEARSIPIDSDWHERRRRRERPGRSWRHTSSLPLSHNWEHGDGLLINPATTGTCAKIQSLRGSRGLFWWNAKHYCFSRAGKARTSIRELYFVVCQTRACWGFTIHKSRCQWITIPIYSRSSRWECVTCGG